MRQTPRSGRQGISQVEVLAGLSLGLLVLGMATHTWGLQRQWLSERDLRQELLDRTSTLHRLLLRLSRQAGARPLTPHAQGWQLDPPYVALPLDSQLTWVHARAIVAQPASEPNCQNTRAWAKDAVHAPRWLRDQFAWIDGQFKCKDTAQANARWQTWVEQVRSARVWLAWQDGDSAGVHWRWVTLEEAPTLGKAVGVRVCLSMDAASPQWRRTPPPVDCAERPLADSGRVWRTWTRVWALRVDTP